jgi:hypothetical protein
VVGGGIAAAASLIPFGFQERARREDLRRKDEREEQERIRASRRELFAALTTVLTEASQIYSSDSTVAPHGVERAMVLQSAILNGMAVAPAGSTYFDQLSEWYQPLAAALADYGTPHQWGPLCANAAQRLARTLADDPDMGSSARTHTKLNEVARSETA